MHHVPMPPFGNTNDHFLGVLDLLAANPAGCAHPEFGTCSSEILLSELKDLDLSRLIGAEYEWVLNRLAERGLA